MSQAAAADPILAALTGKRYRARRQFRVLYRNFLFRVIDMDLLSASGDVRNLLAQFAALLAAYSFVLAVFTLSTFQSSGGHSLAVSAWGLEEFLISTTLTVAGLFAVLAWNSLLPDRRDCLILDPLPLRARTIFRAKGAAIATALGISIVAVNVFTGISIPFLIAPAGSGIAGPVRCFFAYWIVMAAVGAFVFGSIFALQNAAAFLSYPFFQRISGLLQLLVFFVILALFFLTPPLATPAGLSSPANQRLLAWLPSFWFLGLFQELSGTAHPVFAPLAVRSLWSLAAVCLFSFAAAAFTYRRTTRRVIEQPDVAPSESLGMLSKWASALTLAMLADPIDRAILLFSARTLARSRQHRLVLAVYLGTAFAISLAYAKSLMYRTSAQRWDQPGVPLLIVSLVTLFLAVAGSRAVFALPFALHSNWIFRITSVRSPASYFSAVRKSLFALAAAPVLLGAAAVYLSVWPGRPALQHLVVLLLLGILLVQISLQRFRKIPFACSYLPGKSNLHLKFGIGGFVFLLAVEAGANVEYWSMQKPARYLAVLVFLIVATLWAARRTAVIAGSPYNRIQFEDTPVAEIYALDFRRDSNYVNEGDYLDVVTASPPRSFVSKMRRYALGLSLCVAAGFSYQRLGEWRDRQRFPQVGRRIDIGGRSLNLYCSGSGSPAVVMDAGAGSPGYTWKLVEAGVAKLTRACWYDRAGYGWSDPAPRARSAADVARDLHQLLRAAGIPPPYVLVGHSLGGFHIRVFAAHYPDEVAGMVLVDSADEYEARQPSGAWSTQSRNRQAPAPALPGDYLKAPSRFPQSMQSPASYIPGPLEPLTAQLIRFLIHAGLLRLLDNGISRPMGRLPLDDARVVHALQIQPKAMDAVLYEMLSRPATLAQLKAVRSLGAIPLIVLTGAMKPTVKLNDEHEVELLDQAMERRGHVTQAHLATLSTHGRQIILPNVGHGIPVTAPGAIVDAVRDVLCRR